MFRLAPAGNFPSPLTLFNTWLKIRRSSETGASSLLRLLELLYPFHRIYLERSATSGLCRLFQSLYATGEQGLNPVVAVSAFTCPDIAAAAVRAGFRLALLDIDPESLEPLAESLPLAPQDVSALVLSNLYGLPDPLSPWMELSRQHRWVIVDDACQAANSFEGEERIGGRVGTVGVLSFGRGKVFCGSGGGALLLPSQGSAAFIELQKVLDASQFAGENTTVVGSAANFIQCAMSWAFERPELYWLPASLPWLGLGETRYRPDVRMDKILTAQAVVACAQISGRQEVSARFCREAEAWAAILPQSGLGQPYLIKKQQQELKASPIRYPVLFPDRNTRDSMLHSSEGIRAGVSASYARTLADFPALRPHIIHGELRGAKKVSECLATLPVHRFVTSAVREAVSARIVLELR